MEVPARYASFNAEQTFERDGLYRSAFNASGVVKILCEPTTGRIVELNDAACEFYGYPRHQLIRRKLALLTVASHDEVLAQLDLAVGRLRNRFETRHRLASGEVREVEVNIHPAYHNGRHILSAVIFDLSNSQRLERELEITARRLKTALSVGLVGVWEIDLSTRKIWRNKTHDRMFGYPDLLPEWTAERFYAHVVPEDRERVMGYERDGLFFHPFTYQARIQRADGEVRWIETVSAPMQVRNGVVELIGGSIRDITEQKRIEEALKAAKEETEKASRFKDRFLSLVAHDLRNPLSAILGLLRLLASKPERDEASRENMVNAAIRSGERALALMEDLLNVGRFKTGAMKLTMRTIELSPVADKVLASFAESAAAKGVTLENRLPALSAVVGDQTLIEVILQNLLGNALKFAKEEGVIRVSLAPGEPGTLAVFDNGIGMTDLHSERLFAYDAAYSTVGTAGERGTGMGLPLCSDMMQAMGGDLKVASLEGEGSLFYARFPQGSLLFPDVPPSDD